MQEEALVDNREESKLEIRNMHLAPVNMAQGRKVDERRVKLPSCHICVKRKYVEVS